MTKLIATLLIATLGVFALACGSDGGGTAAVDSGKAIKSGPAGNNLTATLSSSDGVLRNGKNTITLKFADASGKAVDVGAAALNFHMPHGATSMNNPATLTTTGTPGVYSGTVNLEMGGEWQAQITYQGPAGEGKATLPVTAQ